MAIDTSYYYQYKLGLILAPMLSSEGKKLVRFMLSWGSCYPTIKDTVIIGTASSSNAHLATLKGLLEALSEKKHSQD